MFNIIYFPITLIHELGHFLMAILFVPDQNPQIKILTFEEGLKCGCVTLGGLEICWETVLMMISGSLSVILITILVVLISNRKNRSFATYFQKYVFFGLLCDLPNLFPTYPVEGVVTDGFRTWLFLHDLINLPYPTPQFSLLFTVIASVLIFYSSFYLGSFLYESFIVPLDKLQKHPAHPSIS
ncbi:MAG: hypothetical protein ACXABU_13110 [Candidatus Hodarchaeales archaeon]